LQRRQLFKSRQQFARDIVPAGRAAGRQQSMTMGLPARDVSGFVDEANHTARFSNDQIAGGVIPRF
jgi:hypothetical protein